MTDYTMSSNQTLLAIQLICYSAIIFVGTFGNIFIFVSIMRKKKRKISDYFIINLTITDLLCCVVSIPFDIMELTVQRWSLGLFMCKLVYPLQTILMAVSVGTLLFMAFERHRAIMHPLRPKVRGKYALLTIISLWVTAIVLVCPYMVVLKIDGSKCIEDWPGVLYVKAFTASVFVLLYVTPLSVIVAAYIRVGMKLAKGNTTIRHAFGASDAGRRMFENRSRRNVRVVTIFVSAVIAFALCLLPFHIMWLWYDFGDARNYRHYNDLLTFANILVYSNSAINPFIFGALSKKFRGCSYILCKRRTITNTILCDGRSVRINLKRYCTVNHEASRRVNLQGRNGHRFTNNNVKNHCLNKSHSDQEKRILTTDSNRETGVNHVVIMISSV
jgi:hypothetical protein